MQALLVISYHIAIYCYLPFGMAKGGMTKQNGDDRQHTLHVCRNKIYTRKNIYSAENSLMRCSSLNRQISNVLFFSATIYPSSPCTTTLFSCVV